MKGFAVADAVARYFLKGVARDFWKGIAVAATRDLKGVAKQVVPTVKGASTRRDFAMKGVANAIARDFWKGIGVAVVRYLKGGIARDLKGGFVAIARHFFQGASTRDLKGRCIVKYFLKGATGPITRDLRGGTKVVPIARRDFLKGNAVATRDLKRVNRAARDWDGGERLERMKWVADAGSRDFWKGIGVAFARDLKGVSLVVLIARRDFLKGVYRSARDLKGVSS